MDNSSVDGFALVDDPLTGTYASASPIVDVASGEIPVKLLYSKSKVYVHPSSHANDAISGYISIVQRSTHEYLVAWIPSKDIDTFLSQPKDGLLESDMTEGSAVVLPSFGQTPDEFTRYALSTPVEEIHSLVVRPPSLSEWYGHIVINFRDGHSSLPFWFHDDESSSTVYQKKTQGGKYASQDDHQLRWGGDEFIDSLSKVVTIIPYGKPEECTYLVGKHANMGNVTTCPSSESSTMTSSSLFEATQMNPLVATLKEAKWTVLEKLARVTKFSREAAADLLSHSAAKPLRSLLPPELQDLCRNETVRRTMDDYDPARIFLAKWATGLAEQSEKWTTHDQRYRKVGVWGQDGWEESTALGVFEVLNSENDHAISTQTRTSPVTLSQWSSFFDDQGRLQGTQFHVMKAIFLGGLDPSIRSEAWLFLTGVYDWKSTAAERHTLKQTKKDEYFALKRRWTDDEEFRSSAVFQEQKHRIDKDVHRTDRTIGLYSKEDMPNPDASMCAGTNKHLELLKDVLCTYNMYNTELGYVQGMSDLVSPLYVVMDDEAITFWAFVGFMERMKSNFLMDQSGMHRQLLTMDSLLQFMDPRLYKHFERTDSKNLFFCFRWLLVWFKREFSWDDTLRLWEVLWTDYLTPHFHIFVALSILDKHRDIIVDYLTTFDEILKYINDLAMTMNVNDVLQRAEILYRQFHLRVEAVDTKRKELQGLVSKATNDTTRADIQADLDALPIVNPLLRDLVSPQSQN